MSGLNNTFSHLSNHENTIRMPVLFVGHGSPMNAVESNSFSRGWETTGKKLPRPKAILSVSAHWVTPGATRVTVMDHPKTIYDFYGFPDELYRKKYPAPGSPEMARETIRQSTGVHIYSDHDWGLDHGTWSVLARLFPDADIPVYQLSLDYGKNPEFHFNLAADLKNLRDKGVLVLGSGNMVHNLRALYPGVEKPVEWAGEFDNKITAFLNERNFKGVTGFQNLGVLARQAHPTIEHFLPLIYTIGFIHEKENIHFFNEGYDMGSISMKSLMTG